MVAIQMVEDNIDIFSILIIIEILIVNNGRDLKIACINMKEHEMVMCERHTWKHNASDAMN